MPAIHALVGVYIVHFLYFLTGSAQLILPKWFVALGLDEGTIGILMGVPGLMPIVATLALATQLDRIDRIVLVRTGASMTAASFLLLPLAAPHPWALVAVRLLAGMGFAATFPGLATLVVDVAPAARRSQALGWFGVFTLGSQAISPYLGELVADHWGFAVFFPVVAAPATAALLATVPLAHLLRRAAQHATPQPPLVPAVTTVAHAGRVLLALTFSIGIAFGAVLTFLPVYFLRAGASSIATLFVANSAAAVAVRILFGRAGDRGNRDRLILHFAWVVAAALALTTWATAQSSWTPTAARAAMAAVGLVFGIGIGFYYPIANARYLDLGSDQHRASRMAQYTTTYAAGITGASFVLGHVAEHLGFAAMYGGVTATVVIGTAYYKARTRVSAIRSRRHSP